MTWRMAVAEASGDIGFARRVAHPNQIGVPRPRFAWAGGMVSFGFGFIVFFEQISPANRPHEDRARGLGPRSLAEYFPSPEHHRIRWNDWRENLAGRGDLRIAKLTPERYPPQPPGGIKVWVPPYIFC